MYLCICVCTGAEEPIVLCSLAFLIVISCKTLKQCFLNELMIEWKVNEFRGMKENWMKYERWIFFCTYLQYHPTRPKTHQIIFSLKVNWNMWNPNSFVQDLNLDSSVFFLLWKLLCHQCLHNNRLWYFNGNSDVERGIPLMEFRPLGSMYYYIVS